MVLYLPDNRRRLKRHWKVLMGIALLLGMAGVALGLKKALDARRGRQMIQWGDTAMAVGKYESAAVDYTRARGHYPNDIDLADKAGDALYQASAARPPALFEARSAWQQALSINPDHLPTLHRLLNLYAELVEITPTQSAFGDLGQIADTVAGLSPDDVQARTLQTIAPLGAWATGHAKSDDAATASNRESDLKQLATLLDQNPGNGSALHYQVMALLRRAREVSPTEAGTADRLLAQAEKRLHAATQSSQANANTWYRAAQGLLLVAQARAASNAATQPTTDAANTALLTSAKEACAKALAVTKSQDVEFVQLRVLQSQIAVAQGDPAAARATLNDTIAQRPDAVPARIAMAELLSNSDGEAAIQILDQAKSIPGIEPGPAALRHQSELVEATIVQATLCVNAAATVTDPADRPAKVDRAQAACDRALADAPNNPIALKASAQLHLLKGQFVDAVRTADRAAKNADHPNAGQDPDLSHIKAMAFWSLHEPEEANRELDAALAANPSLVPPRLLRARILLAQGKLNESAAQAEILRNQAGQQPEVAQFFVDLLHAQAKADPTPERTAAMDQAYAQLPETDDVQRRQKVQQAINIGNYKDAIRLLHAITTTGSIDDAMALAQVLDADHQTDRAMAVVNEALRSHPQNARLLYARKKLSGASEDELKKYAQEIAQPPNDPFTAAMQAAGTALAEKNSLLARQALDRARAIKPDDPDFLDLDFHCDLLEHEWGSALRCAEKLAAVNRDQTNGLYYQFELAMAQQDAPAATKIATTLTNRFDKFSQSWAALGLAEQASNKFAEARDAYRQAWSLEPTSIVALRGLAACCLMMQRDSEADSWISEGLKIAPGDRELRSLQARRMLDRITAVSSSPSSWFQVQQLLADARTMSPDDPNWDALESRMWWGRADAVKSAPLMHKAELLAEKRHFASSKFDPETLGQFRLLVTLVRDELLMDLAAHEDVPETDEAKRIINRFGDASIASAYAHVANAIRLHRLIGSEQDVSTELDAALRCCKKAGDVPSGTDVLSTISAEISPADALHHIAKYGSAASSTAPAFDRDLRWDVARAGLLDQTNDITAAGPVVDTLMPNLGKLPPEAQVLTLRLAADIYGKAKPAPQAEKQKNAYIALLARVPEDVRALNNLAYLLLDQINPPQPQQAMTYSKHAFDIMSHSTRYDPEIADTYGWALANTAQYAEAIDVLEKVVQTIPSPQTKDHLGETYLMAKKPSQAVMNLNSALQLLDAAEHRGTPPDPAFRSRIQDALRRASETKPVPATLTTTG